MRHDKYPSHKGYWDDPWDRQPQQRASAPVRNAPPAPQPSPRENPPMDREERPDPAYCYPGPVRESRSRRRHPFLIAAVILCAVLIISAGSMLWQVMSLRVETVFRGAETEPGDEFEEIFEETTAPLETAEVQCFLERAELSDQVKMETVSHQGLTELSYEEIYAASINSVVSLRCYLADGSGCTGTGIIVAEDGYIVTNEHVIENAEECVVVLQNDQTYDAKLVGMDVETDLAVLKIDAGALIPASFGNSDEMVVGNACVAIGNPLGENFRGTMTTGIISALNRNVSVNGHYMTLIQTDCAINSGNSGGPLINMFGQVVGICNMKMMSTSTTVEGLGFAIPSNTVKTIVNKLIETGEVVRAMLGITAYNLNQNECQAYGVDGGIMVVEVSEESDAYAKGIRNGDIVIAANGTPIFTVDALNTLKSDMSPGDTLVLTVIQEGEIRDYEVTLMEQSVVY